MNVYYTILDWLHLLGTVTWIGGMVFFVLILTPSLGAIDPPQRGKLIGALIKRYAGFAWGAVVLLVITGILISASRAQDQQIFKSTYGTVLGIKHIIVAVMIIIGAGVSFVIGPKLAPKPQNKPSGGPPPSAPPPGVVKLQKLAGVLAVSNLGLGVVLLFLTAALRWI